MNINIQAPSFQSNHSIGPDSGHASQTSSLQFDKPTRPESLVLVSLPDQIKTFLIPNTRLQDGIG